LFSGVACKRYQIPRRAPGLTQPSPLITMVAKSDFNGQLLMSSSLPVVPCCQLPFDNDYAQLPARFFRRVKPAGLRAPVMVSFNDNLAQQMGLSPDLAQEEGFLHAMAGQALLPGSDPIAMKYTGHQFGVYNPDLGDGRGLLLGEIVAPDGKRWDLHLKGAGTTPFSRGGDGRAVLRSSIREYLCSEAMHHLG